MKTTLAMLTLLGTTFAASSALAQTVVNFGTVSQFTGPGDLDLDGNIVKSVNFNGPDLTVGGVNFATDEGDPDFIGPQNVVGWQVKPEYGDTTDDDNLEQIMHDIRWANSGVGENVEAHIPVTPGAEYKVQLLISGNHDEFRAWDIEFEGALAVDEITSLGLDTDTYDIGRSMVFTHSYQAEDDVLDIRMGQLVGDPTGIDPNPIWQGMTVELVPEPSTALLLTLSLAGLLSMCRRKRRCAC